MLDYSMVDVRHLLGTEGEDILVFL